MADGTGSPRRSASAPSTVRTAGPPPRSARSATPSTSSARAADRFSTPQGSRRHDPAAVHGSRSRGAADSAGNQRQAARESIRAMRRSSDSRSARSSSTTLRYQWREYLLFNPYHGFRYLTEYAGHWNVVSTLRLAARRRRDARTTRHRARIDGRTVPALPDGDRDDRVRARASFRGRFASATRRRVATTSPRRSCCRREVNADKEVDLVARRVRRRRRDLDEPVAAGQRRRSRTASSPISRHRFAALTATDVAQRRRCSSRSPRCSGSSIWRRRARSRFRAGVHVTTRARHRTRRSSRRSSSSTAGRRRSASRRRRTSTTSGWASATRWSTTRPDRRSKFAREVSYYHGVEDGESWTEGSRDRRRDAADAFRPAATSCGSSPKAIGRHRRCATACASSRRCRRRCGSSSRWCSS